MYNLNNQTLQIELPKDKTIIKNLFILNDNFYVYFVLNKQVEEIYLLNENEMIYFRIISKEIIKDNLIKYTTVFFKENISNNNILYLKTYDIQDTKLIINNKSFSNIFDKNLYDLFLKIHKHI